MSFRYHVEYKDERLGRTFGIYQNPYSAKEKAEAKKGICHVSHEIYPYEVAVLEKDVVDIKDDPAAKFGSYDFDLGIYLGGGIVDRYKSLVQLLHDIHERRLKGDKLQPGHQFHIGVADGYAHYVVTEVSRVNCTVEWRGFCGDRYRDHHFGWGGKFPKRDVSRYVDGLGRKSIREIFGKQKDTMPQKIKLFPKLLKEFEKQYDFVPLDVSEHAKMLALV